MRYKNANLTILIGVLKDAVLEHKNRYTDFPRRRLTLRFQEQIPRDENHGLLPKSFQIRELSHRRAKGMVTEFTGLKLWEESGHLILNLFSWLWNGVDGEEGIGGQIKEEE